MTSSEVLSPPPPAVVASLAAPQLQSLQLPLVRDVDVVSVTETGDVSNFAKSAWRNETSKASAVSRLVCC